MFCFRLSAVGAEESRAETPNASFVTGTGARIILAPGDTALIADATGTDRTARPLDDPPVRAVMLHLDQAKA